MKNKRIFYLRTDICDEKLIAGGSVTHTLGVIEGFLAHKYTVIVASSIMIELLQNLNVESLNILKCPKSVHWMRWKLNCFFSTFIFLFQSLSILKKKSCVDYIYQRYSILNGTGVLLSKIKKVPLILEYNGSEVWVDTFWSKKKIITLRWLIRFIEWINLLYAHKIIVVSNALKNELCARGIDSAKIIINPNGVNTAQYDPLVLSDQRILLRQKFELTDNFVFGFIGTFNKWHGIELMATIIPEVIKKNNHAAFLLIGDGPLYNYFKQHLTSELQKKVICTGLIPQHEAKNYLAACDAFLCPTQPNPDGTPFFGSPTKIFEYLSMGKPVIASEIGQLIDLINPAIKFHELYSNTLVIDHIGILVPPTDTQAFIDALSSLLQFNAQSYKKMCNNARIKALNEYDWNHHVQKIVTSIEKEGCCELSRNFTQRL